MSRWVTSHGFALNVDTDLRYFQYIVPCGLSKPVTSMAQLGCGAGWAEVAESLAGHFGRVFERDIERIANDRRSDAADGREHRGRYADEVAEEAGDHVERDEPLFEISTDKVDTEIPSPAAGRFRKCWWKREDGWNQHGGARIDEAGGAAPAAAATPAAEPAKPTPAAPAAEPAPEAEAAAAPAAEVEGAAEPSGPLSPLVRRMAREYSIDLSKVKGSGAGGRITKQDLEGYIARQQDGPAPQPAQAAPPPPALSAPLPAPAEAAPPSEAQLPPLPAGDKRKHALSR